MAAIVGILGAFNINATLLSDASYDNQGIPATGIADERGFYYQKYGLLTAEQGFFSEPDWTEHAIKTSAVVCGSLGFIGIRKGPAFHLIDRCALADPLLARLPAKQNPYWRIGHFLRQLPTNYQDSIEQDTNLLTDPVTKSYYDAIRTITRGPLFSRERFRDIVRVNFNRLPKSDWNLYRYQFIPPSSYPKAVDSKMLQRHIVVAVPWNAAGNIVFRYKLEIVLPIKQKISSVDLSLNCNDRYKVEYLYKGNYYSLLELAPALS